MTEIQSTGGAGKAAAEAAGESGGEDPGRPPSSGQAALAAVASACIFLAIIGWQIHQRSALTMDEVHTLLLARCFAAGETLSFYLGSVTRYEGGSWLIAWPVSLLLRLGAYGSGATSWTAGGISVATVALSSWLLARRINGLAGLVFGPLLALCTVEYLHYSYRAWGSLAEALLALPLFGLALDRWWSTGRRPLTAIACGLLLGLALIFSYLHFITALALSLGLLIDGRRATGGLRAAAIDAARILGPAFLVLALWITLTAPFANEALTVRGGKGLGETLLAGLVPRIDLLAFAFPRAWIGELHDQTGLRLAAGFGLSVLAIAAVARAFWKRGSLRAVAWFWVACLPALVAGHSLVEAPQVYRYYLPLLLTSVALLAGSGPKFWGPAALLGLAFWIPEPPPMPYQNPSHTYLELGGNALHRYSENPHRKFQAFRSQLPERQRPWFSFGYGVDSGTRYESTRQGLLEIPEAGRAESQRARNPHLHLLPVGMWTNPFSPEASAPEHGAYLFGLGVGLMADGTLSLLDWKAVLHTTGPARRTLLMGVGAAVLLGLESESSGLGEGWAGPLREEGSPQDWGAVGRGMSAIASDKLPPGMDLGVGDGPEGEALSLAQGEAVLPEWRAMARVPVVPTPRPQP